MSFQQEKRMKSRFLVTVATPLCVIAVHAAMFAGIHAFAQQSPESAAPRPAPDPSNYHGTNRLMPTDDLLTGRRRFEAGAHTAWHIHPGGQLLHVEDGAGVVQRRGEAVRLLRDGATDFTPAGVAHWHGAAPDMHGVMAMVHFGGIGPWLEPVTNAEYAELTEHLSEGSPSRNASESFAATGSENYTGSTSRLPADDLQVARGRFEPSAYSNWHVHPRGQVVIAEEGAVLLQRRGERVRLLQAGTGEYTPPGVPHWHGATPDAYALMVVLGFGAPTVWLEPVTDEEYARSPVDVAR
jgi:quercetin dioxygenase-like cupin family protein